MNKLKAARIKRAIRGRMKMKELQVPRLCIYRSYQHIYAQLISPTGDKVIASASSLDKKIQTDLNTGGNINAAAEVGKLVANRITSLGIHKVAFDRSGFLYHGRIKALAEAAREAGLEF